MRRSVEQATSIRSTAINVLKAICAVKNHSIDSAKKAHARSLQSPTTALAALVFHFRDLMTFAVKKPSDTCAVQKHSVDRGKIAQATLLQSTQYSCFIIMICANTSIAKTHKQHHCNLQLRTNGMGVAIFLLPSRNTRSKGNAIKINCNLQLQY